MTLHFDLSHKNISPQEIEIVSQTEFSISSFSSVLHYGQSIFEGLKAYRIDEDKVGVFRLNDHAKRFKRSAEIMGMPAMDEELFINCVLKYVASIKHLVPREEGHSLYLRPLMFANDEKIKVSSAEDYRFVIMSSIVGNYFSSGKVGSKVLVGKDFIRAFPHGTGEAKTAANYALSLPALKYAHSLGFEQVLYLDAHRKTHIEELGGMNFFMLKENKLITPALGGTILSGITRQTLIEIASEFDLEVEDRDVTLEEVLNSEGVSLFASGTAATVVPIIELGHLDTVGGEVKSIHYKIDPMIEKLRNYLESCHHNKTPLSEKYHTIL